MVSKKRRFTREFKIETVKLVTVYKWTRQYSDKPHEAFPGIGHMTPDAEMIRQLKRENKRLKMERDILKKAMDIFSKDQN